MVVLLHGAAGGWDELAIAVAALAVLWVAVKLAGRKGGNDDDDEDDAEVALDEMPEEPARKEPQDSPRSSPSRP
ncbi:MAG: hypothetical protein JO020_16970 [Chloroflexi bacterium]|nr:hypothetical protein [Chloroflexota bacterium]MBV9134021.1 hypothetical protein [Chloroflexota bacterium]MBV9895859.1 hypothetical protein [Chloroflexota bacterium]